MTTSRALLSARHSLPSVARWRAHNLLRIKVLLREDQRSKMFGYVIRITIDDARRLPAHEVTLRIFAETIDAIKIGAPFGAGLDGVLANRFQRDLGCGVPHVIFLVDAALTLPAGFPVGFIFF